MSRKDDVITIVVGTFIIAVLAVIVYFGFDFLCHIANRIDYPIWKVSIMYFTSVFIIVASSFLSRNA